MKQALVVALSALLLAACGSGGGNTESTTTGVTVDTRFGPVTIDKPPTRVVALGWSDAETALALGVRPVGASDWLAFGGKGVGPWAEGLYQEAPKLLGTTEIDYEAVAALQPDLILNTRSDNDEKKHETLSRIAPTIAAPKDVIPYGTTWRQQVESVAKALGKVAEGGKIIADLDAKFAANKNFDGRTTVVGAHFDGKFGAYVSGDARTDFMKAIGFTPREDVEALASGTFYVDISAERLDLLDADLTVLFPIGGDASALRANPLVNEKALILEDKNLVNAFSSGSSLGMAYALDHAVPLFTAAMGR
ncbi:iron complex transport system substrate-binding protein [Saccharothrix ecbatanensis]|uniref:Iron complex transport system substrate-binding protein n=1 Tax=Saccharothrix ecbatanensis TaxID=1105145 RepID=A0A7W9HSA7_9PSEU|nr:iron-siderophore ABC transporter substrate-binding protein [Saccharothrix ecbatanensis]MBB5807054.1 iron complex transport system substrate-binding protein [Saccharothrix ecbatanensis]